MKVRSQHLYWLIFIVVAIATTYYLVNLSRAITSDHKQFDTTYAFPEKKRVIEADIVTSRGDISLELYPHKAPQTVRNFVQLAEEDFYQETRFHRVIPDFIIQGGDPKSRFARKRSEWGTGGPGYTFQDEINNLSMERGVIAMANRGPDTNGSQFFILTADEAPWLEGKHTIFGRVEDGMDVISQIEQVPTNDADQPTQDVFVKDITIANPADLSRE